MKMLQPLLLFYALAVTLPTIAQDTLDVKAIKQLPTKYLTQVNNKIDKYQNRITSKTEKTLTKLVKWENKIKHLLQKVDPQTAANLFGEGNMSFATMLQKVKAGEVVIAHYKANYNAYNDKLNTSIKYLETQKNELSAKTLQPLSEVKGKLKQLDSTTAQSEAVSKLIKERKQQLIDASIKYAGSAKFLKKIAAENYYYVETLSNYKEIFTDTKKAEETALNILNRIPAFEKFTSENSMLASLFGKPSSFRGVGGGGLAGLQTRASVNSLIQNRIAAGGPNAAAQVSANIQAAQAELGKLKDKVLKAGGISNAELLPESGTKKLNTQKTKTLKQRLEYGTNFNISKPNVVQPNMADMALTVGYKLNDKSVLGVGASYKMGVGSIRAIKITHEGIGLRSFIDCKLKKNFFLTGGYEMNYNTAFANLATLNNFTVWNSSGLLGLSKKIPLSSSFGGARGGLFKQTNLQLLYNLLHQQNTPNTQPLIFRVGYGF
jgi:hypothetical protein